MGAPKNFYNAVDLEKFGLNNLDKRLAPVPTVSDEGKVVEVVEGELSYVDIEDRLVPAPTAADEDKILGVVDGELAYIDDANYVPLFLTGTLTAGQTSLTIEDEGITLNAIVDIYTDVFGVDPTNVVVTNGSITITFDAQASDLNVKVVIL